MKNYRESKNDLIHCPFNPNHIVKRSRLITHKKVCPDKNKRGIIQCPYNPSHHILIENLEKHKEKCPDKVEINSDLADEMEAYIKGIKTGENKNNDTKCHVEEKEKENNPIKMNEVVGLDERKKNGKINKKKKQKKVEEKIIDLENISNKDLFNYMFNDKMCIEYDSDSNDNEDNDDDNLDELREMNNEVEA